MPQFEPEAALRLVETERVSVWGSVPSVFMMQAALPAFETVDLSSVELIVWEGAAMPGEMVRRLAAIGPPLATNYGMTETTSAVTLVDPTHDLDVLTDTVGVPFDEVEVRLDADGALAPTGEAGEVQTRSPLVMLGYWRDPEATAAAFTADGWFRTGDLAVQRPDGRYRIVGRLKEMYKSGGYNVYPREVEAVLEGHGDVHAAAVVGAPDPLWQEVGVAFVVAPRANAAALDAHCRARLAVYKVPKRFVLVEALPLLPIGKVDKAALARLARGDAG